MSSNFRRMVKAIKNQRAHEAWWKRTHKRRSARRIEAGCTVIYDRGAGIGQIPANLK